MDASPAPTMFDSNHYVPILKAKAGEFMALANVEEHRRAVITPFLDVPERPTGRKKRATVEAHLVETAKSISAAWGATTPVFADLSRVGEALSAGDEHPVTFFAEAARQRGVSVIPVTYPGAPRPQRLAVASVAGAVHGACIRVLGNDLLEGETYLGRMDEILRDLGLPAREIDVVLDFRAVKEDHLNVVLAAMEVAIRRLPYVEDWRTLTVAASAFPQDLSMIRTSPGEIELPRTEWRIWPRLHAASLPRMPSFADYGISHPDFPEERPGGGAPVSVRYTRPATWFCRRLGRAGRASYGELAQWLVKWSGYYGKEFSWGDRLIDDYAEGRLTRGPKKNPRTMAGGGTEWRAIGTSHHLAVVADDIKALRAGASPAAP